MTGIRYHAYAPLAQARLAELERATRQRFDLDCCEIRHAVGELRVGDVSVVIRCGAAHRPAAFDACRWAIDTLKATVPIWKEERYADAPSRFLAGQPMTPIPE